MARPKKTVAASRAEKGVDAPQTESVSGTLDVISDAAKRGAEDASAAASRTLKSAAQFANRFVYTTCYTISYGVVFPTMLLVRSIPRDNAAVRGVIDGADDARAKADEVYHSLTTPAPEGDFTALSSA